MRKKEFAILYSLEIQGTGSITLPEQTQLTYNVETGNIYVDNDVASASIQR